MPVPSDSVTSSPPELTLCDAAADRAGMSISVSGLPTLAAFGFQHPQPVAMNTRCNIERLQRGFLGTADSGRIHHLGAMVGGAVGWKSIFLGAELDLTQSFGRTTVLFERVDLSGFSVMPALYLYGQF